jgi:hypothetical protein
MHPVPGCISPTKKIVDEQSLNSNVGASLHSGTSDAAAPLKLDRSFVLKLSETTCKKVKESVSIIQETFIR